MPSEQNPPKVFISYSHDSQEHFDRILLLSDTLREWGIDCHIDQYELAPTDWLRWMERRIREADFVLVVCTATYCRRFNGEEEPGKGLGVRHEGGVISVELYNRQTETAKFIPILFSTADAAHIPMPLQATNRYALNIEQLETDRGFENLYRQLTNQPRVAPKPLGKVSSLPPINRKEDFEKTSDIIKPEITFIPSDSVPIRPKVFISYSHDSQHHIKRVVRLSDALCHWGIDCHIDQYDPPQANWFSWMEQQIRNAEYVLIICTEAYCRRFEQRESRPSGVGWEGGIITTELFQREQNKEAKFIPIVFSQDDFEHIPKLLTAAHRHQINVEKLNFKDRTADYNGEMLYRHLVKIPNAVKPELGQLVILPPIYWQDGSTEEEIGLPPTSRIIELPKPRVIHQDFTEDLGNGIKLEMIAIPGGSFQMGSNDYDDEKPIHRVTISPFHIGKFQVTQAQWKAVMKTNPSHFKGDTLPVERVSWKDAFEFCLKLSEKTGNEYRLPTEAEWEYACRAGSTGKYCFGDDESKLKDYAWYYENSGNKTHPVGEKLPNDWGLHDMHGNVYEWCQDWYDSDYYKQSPENNPQGPTSGESRVARGGSWGYFDIHHSANRGVSRPAILRPLGCRVVCVVRAP